MERLLVSLGAPLSGWIDSFSISDHADTHLTKWVISFLDGTHRHPGSKQCL